MAAAADRLSGLSDDIITRILSFLPSGEAARTTALSSRWRRPLWLYTGVVHIDYRSYSTISGSVPDRRLLADHADHAYACLCSSGRFPKKLSVVMPDDAIVCDAGDMDNEQDVEDPAGIEAEEDADGTEWLNNSGLPRCTPPFAAIRLLELTGYDLKPYQDHRGRQLAFPRLETMRLRRCRTELATLQNMISAAPNLADVSLHYLSFVDYHDVYRLRCEVATVIVMENCCVLHDNLHFGDCRVQLDAPRLLRFRYAHVMAFEYSTSFSFGSPTPPHLEQVHLEVHSANWVTAYPRRSILVDFSYVRSLMLTAYSIADLDIELVPVLHNLERLEIEELCSWSAVNHGAAAKVVVDLLRKCPSLVDLRVKFSWRKYLREIIAETADEMAAIADFSLCRSVNVDDDTTNCCCALKGIHEQFCCGSTISGLRKVAVEFDAEELTCFQVRLIGFLDKSAVDLQEFVIHGGKGYDSRRIHRKVERWRKRWRPPQLA